MLHRVSPGQTNTADILFFGKDNYVCYLDTAKIGFYALRIIFDHEKHEESENDDIQEALELGEKSGNFSEHVDPWG